MENNRVKRTVNCPYCFEGNIFNSKCVACGETVPIKSGIPSFIQKDTGDKFDGKLGVLAKVEKESLDDVLAKIRDNYLDGSVVDRFFKTRTANWRVLDETHLSGRGLIIGNHEEKVGILLSELLNETYTVDTSLVRLRAQTAVANAIETNVSPLHGEVGNLPFPPNSFDVIAIQCRASEIKKYLSAVKKHVAAEGTVLLLVDGWPRESGLTELIGLGEAPSGFSDRFQSVLYGHSFGIKKIVRTAGFTASKQYALLSTNRHENERAFEAQSGAALDWLLHGSSKTAKSASFSFTKGLSKTARKSGVLEQCYPRYLFVCKQNSEKRADTNENVFSEHDILISGKNRSTVLRLDGNNIQRIRKIPNSRRQAHLNENASDISNAITGAANGTVPSSRLVRGSFGFERHEKPVLGTPLDQTLEATPESVNRHVKIVFDWLTEFQKNNIVRWVEKGPGKIEEELTIKSVGLTDVSTVNSVLEIPLVVSHGDLFGSNIYIEDERVANVIDWEWAQFEANPIVDAGFFLLQIAEYIGKDFEDGFQLLFSEDAYASQVCMNIREFCETLGIRPKVFIQYFPIGYIIRIKKDLKINKRLDIDWVTRVQHIWDNHSTNFGIDLIQ